MGVGHGSVVARRDGRRRNHGDAKQGGRSDGWYDGMFPNIVFLEVGPESEIRTFWVRVSGEPRTTGEIFE